MKGKAISYILTACLLVGLVITPLVFEWHRFRFIRKTVVAVLPTPIPDLPFPTASPLPTTGLPLPTTSTSIVGKNSRVKAHILMYHYIRSVDQKKDPLGYRLSVLPSEFDKQLTLLQSMGYKTISMADLAAGKGDGRSVVLTFDDGYEDFYTDAYPILKKHGMTATLYIITNKIDGNYMSWNQIKELQKNGFEIGDHTLDHEELNKLTPEAQRKQIFESKTVLEQQLGVPVTAFSYPVGRYNDITINLVKEAGFTTATTTQPGLAEAGDNLLTLKRVRMSPDMSQSELERVFR